MLPLELRREYGKIGELTTQITIYCWETLAVTSSRIQGPFLGRLPLAKQWSKLSSEMLTASKRRTVGRECPEGL